MLLLLLWKTREMRGRGHFLLRVSPQWQSHWAARGGPVSDDGGRLLGRESA